MRTALVCLIAALSVAPALHAQMNDPMAPAVASPPPAPEAAAAPAAPAPAVAEAPPAPPPAPTDPTAIALLSTLESVCIPAAAGGDLAQAAKSAGYHKAGDNFVMQHPGFKFTIQAPGSNPTTCHVNIVHPLDPESPAKPLIVALHNWAAVSRGWNLYRNDKNVADGEQFTTRSWEHSEPGKAEALVLTTIRKADGSPAQKDADTSEMIYHLTKTAS